MTNISLMPTHLIFMFHSTSDSTLFNIGLDATITACILDQPASIVLLGSAAAILEENPNLAYPSAKLKLSIDYGLKNIVIEKGALQQYSINLSDYGDTLLPLKTPALHQWLQQAGKIASF